jgi:DNA-binding SARP family transcriptional activator
VPKKLIFVHTIVHAALLNVHAVVHDYLRYCSQGNQQMMVQLLGRIRVVAPNGHFVEHFRTRKSSELLGLLVTHTGESLYRETIGEWLWPGSDRLVQRNRLRYELCHLKRLLPEGLLQTQGQDLVCLHVPSDYLCFDQAAQRAMKLPRGDTRVTALEAALASYGGAFLPGHYAEWVLTERTRLEGLQATLQYHLDTESAAFGERLGVRCYK